MTKEEIRNDIDLLRAQLNYVRKAEANATIHDNRVWLRDFGHELSRRINELVLGLALIEKDNENASRI